MLLRIYYKDSAYYAIYLALILFNNYKVVLLTLASIVYLISKEVSKVSILVDNTSLSSVVEGELIENSFYTSLAVVV